MAHFLSIRNALVLSITIAPRFTASGANCFETVPPALNNAISTPSKLSGVASCTVNSSPLNTSFLPADRFRRK